MIKILEPEEKKLIQFFTEYVYRLREAAQNHNPSIIVNYAYELAKAYNKFYQTLSVLGDKKKDVSSFRIFLSKKTAFFLQRAMEIARVKMPARM